jgi:hypothetical protein
MQIIPADVAACRADSRGADRPLLASLYDSLCIILFMLLDFRICVIVMLRHESIVDVLERAFRRCLKSHDAACEFRQGPLPEIKAYEIIWRLLKNA